MGAEDTCVGSGGWYARCCCCCFWRSARSGSSGPWLLSDDWSSCSSLLSSSKPISVSAPLPSSGPPKSSQPSACNETNQALNSGMLLKQRVHGLHNAVLWAGHNCQAHSKRHFQHRCGCQCAMQAHPIVFLVFMVVVVRWRGGKSG